MKVSELIQKLQDLQDCMGDVKVEVYSDTYCLDIHNIEEVQNGWDDGWNEHQDVIGICITR